MRAAIYARVSTDQQTVDNQLGVLREVAERNGWVVVQEYLDEGISGATKRAKRPGLASLMKAVVRREVDVVLSWSVDRLGRSLQDLVATLEDLRAKDVGLYLHQQGLDTTTPSGRAMFQMLGVFAEFERAIISERTKAGLARARAQGKRLGRPPISPALKPKVMKLRAKGWGIHRIRKELGCGAGTVQRILAAAESA